MRKILAGAIAAVCLSPVALRAEVIRFDIVERGPAFAGRSFGDVGAYERITARATIALNPSDDRNAVITDLAQAPRSPDGRVEATADVVILRPADPTRGNGTLLLEAPNVRFGLPGRNPRHPQDPAWQADLFPFTYATLSDPLSGKTDGLLRRCALSVTCPRVMQ